MTLSLRRVILFTHDVPSLAAFYRDVLGLRVLPGGDDGFTELDAGGCRIALHRAGAHGGGGPRNPAKLAFAADDVASARADLVARGARFGPVREFGALHLCDGEDPDGNPLQLSNRP